MSGWRSPFAMLIGLPQSTSRKVRASVVKKRWNGSTLGGRKPVAKPSTPFGSENGAPALVPLSIRDQ